jgi:autoinducer 2-degrading protein
VSNHVVLVARYTVKPGNTDAVLAELEKMKPLVKANEPGCVTYHVNRAREAPDTLLLYEEYVDQAAVDTHSSTPYFQEIIVGKIIPMLEKREREFFAPAIR